jgi:hypothetical protein
MGGVRFRWMGNRQVENGLDRGVFRFVFQNAEFIHIQNLKRKGSM